MSLRRIVEVDFLKPNGRCRTCGSPASEYLCNRALIAERPEAATEDWWIACDNVECEHHHGDPFGWDEPDWWVSPAA